MGQLAVSWFDLSAVDVIDSDVDPSLCPCEVIMGHGEPAARLCNKDPFALKSLSYLARIFPKAKFVLMLRDGRATVHSMISRKVGLTLTLLFLYLYLV